MAAPNTQALAAIVAGKPTAAAPLAGAPINRSRLLAQYLEQSQQEAPQIRSGGELAARLLGQYIAQSGYRKASANEAAAAQAKNQAAAATLFPNDPQGQAAFLANPEAMTGALAERYKPSNVGAGDTRFMGAGASAQNFTAPKLGVDGGFGFSQGPQGISWQAQRPQNYVEQQGGQRLAADITHMQNQDQVAQGQLGVAQGNLAVNQGQLGINRDAFNARKAGIGGFGTPGVGSVIGPTLGPEWQVQ